MDLSSIDNVFYREGLKTPDWLLDLIRVAGKAKKPAKAKRYMIYRPMREILKKVGIVGEETVIYPEELIEAIRMIIGGDIGGKDIGSATVTLKNIANCKKSKSK